MNRLSARNNQLKFEIPGELSIILKESVEYTSIEWKQNRKMSACKPIGFSQFHVQLREMIQFRGQTNDPVRALWITAQEDPSVSYRWTGWVWEMIKQLKFETSFQFTQTIACTLIWPFSTTEEENRPRTDWFEFNVCEHPTSKFLLINSINYTGRNYTQMTRN